MATGKSNSQPIQAGSAAADAQLAAPLRNKDNNARCAKCDAPFHCGSIAAAAHCWCFEVPKILVPDARATACFCPHCLSTMPSSVTGDSA